MSIIVTVIRRLSNLLNQNIKGNRYMAKEATEIEKFEKIDDLRSMMGNTYMKQINNFFGDQQKALRFLSAVTAAAQRLPKLLECTPESVINSFMMSAQMRFMPSDISGEAYVLPYLINKEVSPGVWKKILVAQFQLGYQGLVTLFYRAGVKKIVAEIVYENDQFSYVNGEVDHRPDIFSDKRGKAKGAYVIVELSTGGIISKVMSKKEILDIAEKFSKSWGGKHTPWDEKNDPQLWMWRKTVLKQTGKLVPKNEELMMAIAEDNKDSIIADRLDAAINESKGLTMGSLMTHDDKKNKGKKGEAPEDQNKSDNAEGVDAPSQQ